MKFGLNIKYLCAFIIIFLLETVIAVFVRDDFIRPYIGDVLVVVLMYCFIKAFVKTKTKLLPVYLFVFATLVELGQYFSVAELLGLSDNTIARIMIGSTFDIKDIACYLTGCVLLWILECLIVRITRW